MISNNADMVTITTAMLSLLRILPPVRTLARRVLQIRARQSISSDVRSVGGLVSPADGHTVDRDWRTAIECELRSLTRLLRWLLATLDGDDDASHTLTCEVTIASDPKQGKLDLYSPAGAVRSRGTAFCNARWRLFSAAPRSLTPMGRRSMDRIRCATSSPRGASSRASHPSGCKLWLAMDRSR